MNYRSKILKSLSLDDISTYTCPQEIDVIISCGGFYGFYVLGVSKILNKLEKEGRVKIHRYAGSSVGAICSVLMCSGVSPEKTISIYHDLLNHSNYFNRLKTILLDILPLDAYIQCSGKVNIIATRITLFGFQKEIFNRFTSNEDLVEACIASSNCPYFVSPYLYYTYKNKAYIDGCFCSILPVFQDAEESSQLCIRLFYLKNSIYNMLIPNDYAIEGLVVKGAIETDAFFKNLPTSNIISWYDKKKHLQHKRKKKFKYLLLSLSIPLSAFGLFYLMRYKKDKKV